jgi:hypothetical protein
MSREAMKLALEALENSVDLVSHEARNAEELYGKYPSRLARIQGLVAFEVAHEKAITALREALNASLAEQPTQQGHSCYCPNCEALSKELAELQAQKPIAWRVKWPAIGGGYKWMMVDSPLMEKEGFVNEALYTSPPAQRKPLTDEQQIAEALRVQGMTLVKTASGYEVLKLGQITAHNIKEQPAQQEPVAAQSVMTVRIWRDKNSDQNAEFKNWHKLPDGEHILYTSPPAQQEPVTWGVDWGKAGDIPCVSIIKRLPGGGIEVVAVEYAPYEYNPTAKRTWVGLTDEDVMSIAFNFDVSSLSLVARAIEAKLKERNQ